MLTCSSASMCACRCTWSHMSI